MAQFLGLVSGVLMTWPRPQVPQFVGLVSVLMTWPRLQVPQFLGLVSGVLMTWPRLQFVDLVSGGLLISDQDYRCHSS